MKNKLKNKHEPLRRRLAIIYAIVGWNMFGVMFYTIIKRKIPEDSTERSNLFLSTFDFDILFERMTEHLFFAGISYGLLTGTSNNMHVYQVTGLTLTNDFDGTCQNEITQVEKENEKNEKAIANEI